MVLAVLTAGPAHAQPVAPTVATLPASAVGVTNATFNGMGNPTGFPTFGLFEWGTTTNYGNVTPARALGSGSSNTNFSQGLSNLAAGSVYHFRAVVSNSFYYLAGTNQSFGTYSPLPYNILFSENFDVDRTGNWVVNSGPGANAANFFFDYSAVGIPPAPHSAGTTRGLKLEANYAGNVEGGISVSPRGRDFTNDYVMTFDIWLNFVGPAPAGGNGSTQVTGAGVDTEGIAPQWGRGAKDSIFFGLTGDGGSPVDYRAYSIAEPDFYPAGNPVYATPSGGIDSSGLYYSAFGGNTPPATQTALFPQQTGTTASGAAGFRWHAGSVIKEGDKATFRLDGRVIARVTVSIPGIKNILFTHFDVNATSSTDPNVRSLQFGLIDNVVVAPLGIAPPRTGDFNGDGVVDATELNAFLAEYYSTSAWLRMTNVAGLGGSNVTFALSNSTAGAFSVEYTTNLMNWFLLGPATPRYLFTDTNASAVPQRYYRLRWP